MDRSNFWYKVHCNWGETKRKLPCVQSQLIIEMKRKGRKKKPKVAQITQIENCKARTEPEKKEVYLAVVTGTSKKRVNHQPMESVVTILLKKTLTCFFSLSIANSNNRFRKNYGKSKLLIAKKLNFQVSCLVFLKRNPNRETFLFFLEKIPYLLATLRTASELTLSCLSVWQF